MGICLLGSRKHSFLRIIHCTMLFFQSLVKHVSRCYITCRLLLVIISSLWVHFRRHETLRMGMGWLDFWYTCSIRSFLDLSTSWWILRFFPKLRICLPLRNRLLSRYITFVLFYHLFLHLIWRHWLRFRGRGEILLTWCRTWFRARNKSGNELLLCLDRFLNLC